MWAFIGGLAALAIGVILLIVWWSAFLIILQGGIPLILILGGLLAAYLGFEEIRDKIRAKKEESIEEVASVDTSQEEIEKYKEEVEKLKAELEELKKQQQSSAGQKEEK